MSNGYPPQGGEGEGQRPPQGAPPQQGQPQYPQQGQQPPQQGQPPYPQQGQPPYPQQGQPQYPQQGQQPPQQGQPPYPQQGQQPPPQYPPGQQPYPQQGQGGYQQFPQGGNQYQQGPGVPAGASGPRANFGQRLGALLLDALIIGIPLAIVGGFFGVFSIGTLEVDPVTGEITSGGGFFAASLLLFYLFVLAAFVVYYGYFEGGPSGQTLGKKALGIRVIRQDTGGPLGWGKAIGRYAVRAVPGYVPFLGAIYVLLDNLWMLWDPEKQTLHDKVVSTLVVPLAAYPIPQPGGYQQQGGYGPPR